MSTEFEKQIKLTNGGNRNLRSWGEQNGIHCLGEQTTQATGEPISNVDLRLFQMALVEEGGVNPKDARERVKEIRRRYQSGDYDERQRLADVIGNAFVGLTTSRRFEGESIPVHQEVVVYRNR